MRQPDGYEAGATREFVDHAHGSGPDGRNGSALPPAVSAGLESLARLCVDVDLALESADLAVGRVRVEYERARQDESGATFQPRTNVAWQMESLVYTHYNGIRRLAFERNAAYALAAASVLQAIVDGRTPGDAELLPAGDVDQVRRILDDAAALRAMLPRPVTGNDEVDDVLGRAHRAVLRALGAAGEQELPWSQAHLHLAELVDEHLDLDPPVAAGEPGINISLRAYAQGCHGVVLGMAPGGWLTTGPFAG
ncbi:hypothetical protein LO772_17500 [Yinghuangia sp. ASG 101]|uniref:hypothetical protein n=1 Tax=Yinghuangia sp. ASG 101 TaxID=2896848 RepID=UPI001E544403|nr:hypothetical protein [Yinghuangia sp. ASG 101]UGQ15197.1 hypothetical protein LO772_17500 [Yinghuangia sp. ASG 101]